MNILPCFLAGSSRVAKIRRSNRWLSKFASIFVLAFVEGIFMPFNHQWFSTPTFVKTLANKRSTNEDYRQVPFWPSGRLGQVTPKSKKSPRGIRPRRCCPSPKVRNILRPLKIRALTCVAKDATSICLAERKPEVWGKWLPKKKQEKPQGH